MITPRQHALLLLAKEQPLINKLPELAQMNLANVYAHLKKCSDIAEIVPSKLIIGVPCDNAKFEPLLNVIKQNPAATAQFYAEQLNQSKAKTEAAIKRALAKGYIIRVPTHVEFIAPIPALAVDQRELPKPSGNAELMEFRRINKECCLRTRAFIKNLAAARGI